MFNIRIISFNFITTLLSICTQILLVSRDKKIGQGTIWLLAVNKNKTIIKRVRLFGPQQLILMI